jgi:hypothetical protein
MILSNKPYQPRYDSVRSSSATTIHNYRGQGMTHIGQCLTHTPIMSLSSVTHALLYITQGRYNSVASNRSYQI